MPAQFTKTDNMMYVGEVPWHRLGTYVGDKAVTSEEAIRAASLDWSVTLRPLYASVDSSSYKIVDTHYAVVRVNNNPLPGLPEGDVLGVVGGRYTPVQNLEAFNFFDSVVGSKQAIYHTAGSLCGGKKVWILAKLPDNMNIKGKDTVEKFLLLSNTHDGSGCLRMLLTPVRVVCANTLNLALRQGTGEGIAIRHTGSIEQKIKAAQEALGLAVEYYKTFEVKANWLADQKFTDLQMQQVLKKLFPADNEAEVATRTQNNRNKVMSLFQGEAAGSNGFLGTAWQAVQAVSEFADHHKTVRNSGEGSDNKLDNRLNSVWFGSSAAMKQKGFEAIEDALTV